MDNADTFAGGVLAGGDKAIPPHETGLKRDQESVDDFEHLGGETSRREEPGASPFHERKMATQSFLDTEREEMFVQPARAELSMPDQPSVGSLIDKIVDHVADKFTDSESDADTAGESPLHRPDPARVDHALSPSVVAADPTPVLAPILAPEPPKPTPSVPAEPKLDFNTELLTKQVLDSFEPEISLPKSEPEPLKPEVVLSKTEQEISKEKPLLDPAPVPLRAKHEPSAPLKPEPVAPAKPEPTPTLDTIRSPTAHVIEAEVIFCQMGLDAWFDPQRLHPKVESLMYWRDPARSGIALGAGLALLVALACCSVVSVLAYGSLLLLVAAVAFRIYKNVLQAVQKTNDGHPFKWLLERDISIPAERAQASAAAATAHLNAVATELRRLFLVEDLVDSLKFGVLLWCLTYVGACFNGITLIILGWIALFTLPKAYEMNKAQVDANLELARGKINEISAKVRAAVPLGRKSESEKDK